MLYRGASHLHIYHKPCCSVANGSLLHSQLVKHLPSSKLRNQTHKEQAQRTHPLSITLKLRFSMRRAGAAAIFASNAEHAYAPRVRVYSMCSVDSWER